MVALHMGQVGSLPCLYAKQYHTSATHHPARQPLSLQVFQQRLLYNVGAVPAADIIKALFRSDSRRNLERC